MSKRTSRGFSLIELAVVMLILGIVLATGIPSFIKYRRDQELVTTCQTIASQIRLYRATALQVGDKRMASVLDDLERVLLEIGHQPAKVSAADLEQVQKRIQTQGILFKVRVTRTKVRDEIRAPLPETAPSRGKGQTT